MASNKETNWIARKRNCILSFMCLIVLAIAILIPVGLRLVVPTRSDPSFAPKSEFGLEPVNSFVSQTQTGIDLVFVHGLGSNPDSTWSKADGNTSVNWVTDLFHEDLEDYPDLQRSTRVFFYNYESYWERDSIKGERLKRLGEDFSLRMADEMDPDRKIILIGHSYGGLVIKEALIHPCLRQTETGQANIIEQTHAVVFLGTPHRGSGLAFLGKWYASLLAIWYMDSNPGILKEVQYDSVNLSDLHNRFMDVSKKMRIINFYEKHKQKIAIFWKQFIVDEQSAVISSSNCESRGLNTDHTGLNKYATRNSDYKTLTKKLRKLMQTALQGDDNIKASTRERGWTVPFGRNKDFIGRESETAQVLDKISLRSHSHECQRTAIWGLGGIGKTQIAIEAAFRFREKHQDCHVFWVPAVDASTFEGAYRDIGRTLGVEGINEDKANVKSLVKTALSQSDSSWLLILDNVDDINIFASEGEASHLEDCLPFNLKGSILITTRDKEVGRDLGIRSHDFIHANKLGDQDAFQLLAKHSGQDLSGHASAVAGLLDFLVNHPLAIKQAAAYMEQTATNATGYLQLCKQPSTKLKLLSKGFGDKDRYRSAENAVATTFLISIKQISHRNPLAAEYLGFMSLLGKKEIPETILPRGDCELESKEAIASLRAYAFITQQEDHTSYDIHSIVRLATRDWLSQEGKLNYYATLVIRQLDDVFPFPNHDNKDTWLVYLPHALKALKFQDNTSDVTAKSRLLLHVAEAHSVLGKYHDALNLCNHSLELRKQEYGEEHPDTLTTMHSCGNMLANLGQLGDAEQLLSDTVYSRTKALGPGDPDTLGARHDYANVLYRRGKYKDAELHFQKTCELQSQNPSLGPGHADTLRSRSNIALMVYSRGDYAKAEELLSKVVRNQTDLLGPNNPDTLRSMGSLARTEYRQGKHIEAEDRLRDTKKRQTNKLGPTHPDTLRSMSSLGRAAYRLENYDDAAETFKETIKWQAVVLGEENSDTLRSKCGLARTYYRQGRYGEAEVLFRQTIELRTMTFSATHPDTLGAKNGLARTLYRQGRYDESKQLFEYCAKHQMKSLGPKHHDTLCSQNGLTLVRQQKQWFFYLIAHYWSNSELDKDYCA